MQALSSAITARTFCEEYLTKQVHLQFWVAKSFQHEYACAV